MPTAFKKKHYALTMKISLFLLLTIPIILIGCYQYDIKKTYSTAKTILPKKIKSINLATHLLQNKDTMLVKNKSAISMLLDSVTLEKRRKEYGDEAFYVGADDDAFYSADVRSFLKKRHLPLIDATGYKYVKFLQPDGSSSLIKTDTLQSIMTYYFFYPSKAPYDIDITDIEREYKNYFQ